MSRGMTNLYQNVREDELLGLYEKRLYNFGVYVHLCAVYPPSRQGHVPRAYVPSSRRSGTVVGPYVECPVMTSGTSVRLDPDFGRRGRWTRQTNE